MFRPLPLFIGLRYTRAKRRNHFISFISLASMLGIAFGVAVLITVLSVMNGFDFQIKSRLFNMVPQVTVQGLAGPIENWEQQVKRIQQFPGIKGYAPYVAGQALYSGVSGMTAPGIVQGIDPKQEPTVTHLAQKLSAGKLSDLKPGSFNIILGVGLADKLGVTVGSNVLVMIPKAAITPIGILPRYKRFKVVGLFEVGHGFGFDGAYGYINMQDAQALFQTGKAVTGINIKIGNLYEAPAFSKKLNSYLSSNVIVSDWTQNYGAFFQAIGMEKTIMFFIVLLIVGIAAFNLVSTLVMVVVDKQTDIAIMRTFGMTPRTVLLTFMVQGTIIGVFGILLGILCGTLLAWNATDIFNWLRATFHLSILTSNVYYVNFLPSKLEWPDVWHVTLAAFLMSLVATLYPAFRASRVVPAEALRYE